MALSIKNDEVEMLARKIANENGLTLTETVRAALKQYERRLRPLRDIERMKREVRQIQEEVAALPVIDDRSPDELLGYDENGLPS